MKISTIIPAYYATQELVEMTSRCLKSLEGSDVDEIILVDDGSPIQAAHDVSTVDVRLDENKGYAGAVNEGLAIATGDILIVSNNDVEFIQPNWLYHLINPIENGYDISCIRTTDSDGWETKDELEEEAKFGSIWAMKRTVYEQLGGLDESYGKGYFEDLDYRRQAINAGFKIVKNHNGLVEHFGKATFKSVDPEDKYYWAAKERYFERWGMME